MSIFGAGRVVAKFPIKIFSNSSGLIRRYRGRAVTAQQPITANVANSELIFL